MTLDKLQEELDQQDGDRLDVDLSIAPELELAILKEARQRWVTDYHRLRTYARLNELVENKQLADQQREEMKRLVRQIYQLDQDIKLLSR